jgi:hypothetical protein
MPTTMAPLTPNAHRITFGVGVVDMFRSMAVMRHAWRQWGEQQRRPPVICRPDASDPAQPQP